MQLKDGYALLSKVQPFENACIPGFRFCLHFKEEYAFRKIIERWTLLFKAIRGNKDWVRMVRERVVPSFCKTPVSAHVPWS